MSDLTGQTIKGYSLKEQIGAGGFGAVYLADQMTVGREVAVKVILPGLANKPEFIRRFESEAQVVARLEHIHITPLYDYWRDPAGAYIVMRYLRGGSLRNLIAQNLLDLEGKAVLLDQVGTALEVAHRNQIVHRDIKPSNILIDEDGNAYLADFGIAKETSEKAESKEGEDRILGSLHYISPEQARGEQVTPQTDIYSLGVVLYEMLTGQHPFPDRSNIERLYCHINNPIPKISGIKIDKDRLNEINAVVQKATAKDPKKRFDNILVFCLAFRNAAGLGSGAAVSSQIVELLTPREQEILSLMVEGHRNKQIAEKLFIEPSTVKWYNHKIYQKLGVRSRVQAIVRAQHLDLLFDRSESDAKFSTSSWSLRPEPNNPYKGLRSFQSSDVRDFFGRGKLVQKLLARLGEKDKQARFLTVIGPSGSGKSSLVKAGLIPALWRGDFLNSEKWFIAEMVPGTHPLEELEVALIHISSHPVDKLRAQLERDARGLLRAAKIILPGYDSELVLVIDQFEEVFTLVEDEKDRQHFLDILYTAVTAPRSRVRVITTLRADFYDRPLQYPQIGELVRSRLETVMPLTVEELESAISRPAERVGVSFEKGLVPTIIEEIHYQPGALPLLQFALTELFEQRELHTLTDRAYQKIGGAVGALAKRAEDLYQEQDRQGQESIHQLFLRLVTLNKGGTETGAATITRRRVHRAEFLALASDSELMDEIIDSFTAYRLLTLDNDPASREPTIEVAHEAILQEWQRLNEWINESREEILFQRQLSQAAEEWQQGGQERSYLLHGSRLAQFENWESETELLITPLERDFLEAGITQRETEAEIENVRLKKEAVLESRSRWLLRAIAVLFALAALFSFLQLQNVRRSAAAFRSVALANAAGQALADGRPDMALALALEAANMEDPPLAAEQILFEAASSTWIRQRFQVSQSPLWDAIYHPDGERIITTSADGLMAVWDIESGTMLQSFQHAGQLGHIAIHPNGLLLAIGGGRGLIVWDFETGKVTDIITERGTHTAPVFTRDGDRFVTGSRGTTINIWDTDTLEIERSFHAHEHNWIPSIRFSPDESKLVTSSPDGTVKVWDFESGQLLGTFEFPDDWWGWEALFLPDGERILIAGGHSTYLWDWQSGETLWVMDGNSTIRDIALSPDARTFVAGLGEPDLTAQLREVDTGNLLHEYHGHSQNIQNVDYSPDGKSVLTAGNDGSVILWPAHWEGALRTDFVHSNNVLVWHPERPLVATVGMYSPTIVDGVVRLVDTFTGQVVREFPGHQEGVMTLAFTPDGRSLLSGDAINQSDTSSQSIYIWDIETGERMMALEGHSGRPTSIAVSPDNRLAAVGQQQANRIVLWDLATGERVIEFEAHTDWVNGLVFSPDSRFLFSGSEDGTLIQWEINTGQIVAEFAGHPISINELDLSADGTRLISASDDGTATLWNTASGEILAVFSGHKGFVTTARFSPDERMVLTASMDGSVILWDAETGKRLHHFVVVENPHNLVAAFSPDGSKIITASKDILTTWDISDLPGDLKSWLAANRYIPDFTCEQRDLYQILPLCGAANE